MRVLAPYIAQLSFDVPPPTPQRNIIDRISAKQVQSKIAKKDKKQRKQHQKAIEKQKSLEKKRDGHEPMASDGYNSDSSSSSSSSSSSGSSSYRGTDKRIRKINAKAEQDLMSKGPKKAAEIEQKRCKEVRKATEKHDKREQKREKELKKKISKDDKESEKRMGKDVEKLRKLEYVVIESL
jgi:hypothetical protein